MYGQAGCGVKPRLAAQTAAHKDRGDGRGDLDLQAPGYPFAEARQIPGVLLEAVDEVVVRGDHHHDDQAGDQRRVDHCGVTLAIGVVPSLIDPIENR
jgi:hypothetical protein